MTTNHALIMNSAPSCRPSSAWRIGLIPADLARRTWRLRAMNKFKLLDPAFPFTLLLVELSAGRHGGGRLDLYPPLSCQTRCFPHLIFAVP